MNLEKAVLDKLEKKLIDSLDKETPESLTKWLLNERGVKLYDEDDVINLFKKYSKDFSLYRNIQILDSEFDEWFKKNKK